MKRQSIEWHNSQSTKRKEFKATPSAENVMITVFWDIDGVMLVKVMPRGTSKRVLDFLSVCNGDFDNENQTKEVGDDHDFLRFRAIPADVKCLRPNPVLYLEEDTNSATRLSVLLVVKDGIEDTVILTVYNFTDIAKYKPGEMNAEKLSNIPCEHLVEDNNCHASYRVMREGVFGNLPYCGATVNGQHPRFTCIHYCTSFSTTLPLYVKDRSPMEPYEFQHKSKKYPLINPPADYVSPCGN